MKRRAFLGTAGVALTTIAAGCTSRALSDDPGGAGPTTQTTNPLVGQRAADATRVESEQGFERDIGDGSLTDADIRKPHSVALSNPTDERRVGTLSIRRDDESVFDERFELAAGASARVSLTALDSYELVGSLPDADTEQTETVELGIGAFSCNHAQTTFGVREDGTLESTTVSTMMACPGVVTEHVAAGDETSATAGRGVSSGGDEPTDEQQRPHAVVATNPTTEAWTMRVLVDRDDWTVFDGVYTLEPDATATITLDEAAAYQVSAAVVESDGAIEEAVGPEMFDCNSSSTRISVDLDGDLDAETISTKMACLEDTTTDSA